MNEEIIRCKSNNKDYKLVFSSKKSINRGKTNIEIFAPVDAIEKEEPKKKEKTTEENQTEKLESLNKMNDFKIKIKKEEE